MAQVDPTLALRFARAVQDLTEASHDLVERFARAEGLPVADVRALAALAIAGGPMSAGDLADHVSLTSGAATRLVDRLEASGHAVRVRDPDDRRRVLVQHTDAATVVAQAWFAPLAERLAHRLAGLPPEQAEVVVDVVAALADDLRTTGT